MVVLKIHKFIDQQLVCFLCVLKLAREAIIAKAGQTERWKGFVFNSLAPN